MRLLNEGIIIINNNQIVLRCHAALESALTQLTILLYRVI